MNTEGVLLNQNDHQRLVKYVEDSEVFCYELYILANCLVRTDCLVKPKFFTFNS